MLVPERFRAGHAQRRSGFFAAPRPRPMGAELELYTRRKDGAEFPADIALSPVAATGTIVLAVVRDITGRKQAQTALAERARSAAFSAEVGLALSRDLTLAEGLHDCAVAMVRHLDAAFGRIWLLDSTGSVLVLQASAGTHTGLDGGHSREPLDGDANIARIARERKSHLTNTPLDDPGIVDRDWIKQEGIVAFAGHPLIVEDRVVGVMAVFARQPLTAFTTVTLAGVAYTIALGVERKRVEEALQQQTELYESLLRAFRRSRTIMQSP
ncbi:MAG: GAF domain-containing protein, partial [Chloroflexota bacterium]